MILHQAMNNERKTRNGEALTISELYSELKECESLLEEDISEKSRRLATLHVACLKAMIKYKLNRQS